MITFTSKHDPSLFSESGVYSSVDGFCHSESYLFLRQDVAAAHVGEWVWVRSSRLYISDDLADAPNRRATGIVAHRITDLRLWNEETQMCRIGAHGYTEDRHGTVSRW
jgi:hypothetical protein